MFCPDKPGKNAGSGFDNLVDSQKRALPYLLRAHNFGVKVGSQTRRQVANFQQARHLKVDGIVGPQMWRELLQPAIS